MREIIFTAVRKTELIIMSGKKITKFSAKFFLERRQKLTAFISGTTKSLNRSSQTSGDWRRASLLEAYYVSSETEAKIARVRTSNLLRRLINFSVMETSCQKEVYELVRVI